MKNQTWLLNYEEIDFFKWKDILSEKEIEVEKFNGSKWQRRTVSICSRNVEKRNVKINYMSIQTVKTPLFFVWHKAKPFI